MPIRDFYFAEDVMLEIRRAESAEYGRVKDFYDSLIDAMEGSEFHPGWEKDIYPTGDFLRRSVENGELYLGESGGQLAACMVVNHEYNEGYREAAWTVEAEDAELLVIHILGVHSLFSGRGLAKQMVRKVIDMARQEGMRTIRLDVVEGNLPAEKAYTKVGFRYVDTMRMFYEDTGWTRFRLFEYIV